MKGRIDRHALYRELIATRLDRPLSRVELRQLTSHLKTCAACQSVDAEYKAQRAMLRGLQPSMPPRDMWARTSAGLDREVARSYRALKWQRRVAHGRRSAAQPSTSLMTAIAAIGVTAAIAVLQLAPAIGPTPPVASRPTPLAVSPQQFAFLGMSRDNVAVYRTDVSQVCPTSGPLDCVANEKYVRTPIDLPANMRAGNVALSPDGDQLALVGHTTKADVIAVVMMPSSTGDGGSRPAPTKTKAPAPTSGNVVGPAQTAGDDDPGDASPNPDDQPSAPPQTAVPGLTVLSILDNVQSVGSPPDWSPNGSMLAFSAMPDDGSSGPDVYTWSPGDDRATAVTTDHDSFFASWSGNRIVLSRLTGGPRPHTFVIDPKSGEERAVSGPQLWLPVVNTQRTQAIGWYGQLDTSEVLPAAREGALYLVDWASIDPFAAGAPTPTPTPTPTDEPTATPTPTPTPIATDTPEPTDAPATSAPTGSGGVADPTGQPDSIRHAGATSAPTATPELDNTDGLEGADSTTPPDEEPATASPADNQPTGAPDDEDAQPASVPDSLVALEPDRDPRAAPVVDWQARWSTDGEVLGVWLADSAGSSWGRLAVFAVDPTTQLVVQDDPLMSMTLARRGFSLGEDRVAWVGPASDNVDGELRIRTWGTDGDGGLRLKAPESEEVVPAS